MKAISLSVAIAMLVACGSASPPSTTASPSTVAPAAAPVAQPDWSVWTQRMGIRALKDDPVEGCLSVERSGAHDLGYRLSASSPRGSTCDLDGVASYVSEGRWKDKVEDCEYAFVFHDGGVRIEQSGDCETLCGIGISLDQAEFPGREVSPDAGPCGF